MLAVAWLAGPVWAGEDKKPCCEATVEAGKKCTHECCKKAAAQDKVCKKCHPKKADEKK
jgi:hypothetical protein